MYKPTECIFQTLSQVMIFNESAQNIIMLAGDLEQLTELMFKYLVSYN